MTLPVVFTANGPSGYNLTNSLRFRSSATANLQRTPATTSNQNTWTWSGWIKRGSLGTVQYLFGTYPASGQTDSNWLEFGFYANNTIAVGGWTVSYRQTTQVFRDVSAWYHIVVAIDSTQATASNRVRLYVNGTEVTAFGTNNNPSLNQTMGGVNSTSLHCMGNLIPFSTANPFDGYMAEVNFVDGQQLTPSSFGSTNALTGVWQPAKYTGTYGTNGFYLPFTDNSALTTSSNVGLGKDFSGNANYWTTNNISITAGSTYDSMTDVPTLTSATTANYAVLNPLSAGASATLSSGNLNASLAASTATAVSTIAFDAATTTGFYAECLVTTSTVGGPLIGIRNINTFSTSYIGSQATDYSIYSVDGDKYNNGSSSAYGSATSDGNVIGIAVKNGKIYFRNNNGWFNSADFSAETGFAFSGITGTYIFGASNSNATTAVVSFNFGQQPFAYTPPTGFVALNTFNLPTPTIGATASSQANKYMDVTTYTGNSTAGRVITMSNMTNVGFAWVKIRSGADDHRLANTVTGGNKHLQSNTTAAEGTGTNIIQAFSSNTFTVGSDNSVNVSGSTYVGWVWANDGTSGSTNTAGSITSTVSANTSAGFSVVTYTGTGANATVGHGLGVAPSMVIVKDRSGANFWVVGHTSITWNSYLRLNDTTSVETSIVAWNNTAPTSTVFSVGTSSVLNNSGSTLVAYCFAPIAGYSAFGSYTGNGSTDGPFVFTGFRPRFILTKGASTTGSWWLYDTARSTYNEMTDLLRPDLANADTTQGFCDALSNGFKIRNSGNNNSGATYIYMAFAENPFKYANAR